MRVPWIIWVIPKCCCKCPHKRHMGSSHRHTEWETRRKRPTRRWRWSVAWHSQESRKRQGTGSLPRSLREPDAAERNWENVFLMFQVTKFLVICYSSHGKQKSLLTRMLLGLILEDFTLSWNHSSLPAQLLTMRPWEGKIQGVDHWINK